jgi:hypothetical protein
MGANVKSTPLDETTEQQATSMMSTIELRHGAGVDGGE